MPRIYTHENLVGKQFGRLTVISLHHLAPRSQRYWLCRCECGNEHVVQSQCLKAGKTRSCGCLHVESARETGKRLGHLRAKCRIISAGERFGKLVALEYTGDCNKGWKCKCDCGNSFVARSNRLINGLSTDCGCQWKANVRGVLKLRNFTHGHSYTPGYNNWKSMLRRCTEPRDNAFLQYGGAGRFPCEALKKSPQSMFDAIGPKPSKELELDRTNNNLGYFCGVCEDCKQHGRPTNIRWATRKQQQRNRRNSSLFTIDGVTHCASEWAEKFGLTWQQFAYRYRDYKVVNAAALLS